MSIVRTTQTIDELIGEVDRLEAENRGLADDLRGLRNRLAAAESARDTASADLSYHQRNFQQRTGW